MLALPLFLCFQIFSLFVNFAGIAVNLIILQAILKSKERKSPIDWILSCNINILAISLSSVFIITEISIFIKPIAKNPFICASQGVLSISFLFNVGALVYITVLANLFTVATAVKPSPRFAFVTGLICAISSLAVGLLAGGFLGGPFKIIPAPSGLYCAMKTINTSKTEQAFNALIAFVLLSTPVFVAMIYFFLFRNIGKLFEKLSQNFLVSRAAKEIAKNVILRGLFVSGAATISVWGLGLKFAIEIYTNKLVSPVADGFVATLVHLISLVTGCCFIFTDKDSAVHFSKLSSRFKAFVSLQQAIAKENKVTPQLKSNLVIGAKTAALLRSPDGVTIPRQAGDLESAEYTISTPVL